VEQNEYLQQVMEDQARVEHELRPQAAASPAPSKPRRAKAVVKFKKELRGAEDEEARDFDLDLAEATQAGVGYRITGFWRWQTVVVSPNVYVVHTRRGHAEPLNVGLGISFRYNPGTDAFLVIPAAVQTLIINAKCICRERQGILVQAYVQWIVDDVRTAYRKLDFSDARDPMRIVNVQLREQAEAAIKDKVATMSIDAVLSDKQPIIEELTARLRTVAEGTREGPASTGLGLKIVTVQIKEAVVSSTKLWENLQRPFRAEREKIARLAELETQQEIGRRELADRQTREEAELANARLLAGLRAAQEREAYDLAQAEKMRRHQVEQTAEQQAVAERTATERARKEAELQLALQAMELDARRLAQELEAIQRQEQLDRANAEQQRLRAVAAIDLENLNHEAQSARAERDLTLFKARRAVENDLSEQHVRAQLVARLPQLAAALPKPEELRAVSISGDGSGPAASLAGFLAGALNLADALKGPATGRNGSRTAE
jgi:flotillin